ncbi:unnamed protein product [Calicophoron daubneyi]|uniref:SH3 domain-containing protein n=1 Tax=Calicophoron daubneyi TaxID=300641 RepID=A0AAV2T406_CALDB
MLQLRHLVTLVGGEELSQEDIINQVDKAEGRFVSAEQCTLQMDDDKLNILTTDTKEVLESIPWDNVYNQLIITPGGKSERKVPLLVIRIRQHEIDLTGYTNEYVVFEIRSESYGSKLVDEMIGYQERQALKGLSDTLASPGAVKDATVMNVTQMKENHVSHAEVFYGRNVYMLNRCLDDVGWFEKRLKRSLKADQRGELALADPTKVKPPPREDAVDAVRKIKFALNTVVDVMEVAPECVSRVVTHLMRFTQWLHNLCKREIIMKYEAKLVKDVIEPLLSERTIEMLNTQLNEELLQFWRKLGPAWNTPACKWPNPLASYMPRFCTKPKDSSSLKYNDRISGPPKAYRPYLDGMRDGDVQRVEVVPKFTSPDIRGLGDRQFCKRVQESGGKLVYATVRHVSAKSDEMNAEQGEVFELLRDNDETWWRVRSSEDETGTLPRWKLRRFAFSPELVSVKEVNSLQSHVPMQLGQINPDFNYLADEPKTAPRRPATRSAESLPEYRVKPLIYYVSAEQMDMIEDNKPIPLLLVPYQARPKTKENTKIHLRGDDDFQSKNRAISMNRLPTSGKNPMSPYYVRLSDEYRPKITLHANRTIRPKQHYKSLIQL